MAFNKQSFSANRDRNSRSRGFSRGGFGGRGDSSDRQMFQAVCDRCGKDCQVPFRPTSGKPIYCSDCFEKNRNSDSRSSSGERNYERSSFEDRQMYNAVCDECGNKCSVPFQPRDDKPIYCSDCFEKRNDGGERNNENRSRGGGESNQYKSDFESLNSKLDAILKILTPLVPADEASVEEVVESLVEQPVQAETIEKKKGSKKTSSKKK